MTPKILRLKTDLMRADGGVFRKGATFVVAREYYVNGLGVKELLRFALGDSDGNVVMSCVDPDCVELIDA